MPTIVDLTAATSGDISDDDFIIVYENGASGTKTKRVTKANFLAAIGAAELTGATFTDTAQIDFTSGGGISDMVSGDLSITISGLAAGATEDKTGTLTGAATTDLLLWSFTSGAEAGVLVQAWISAANTVTFRITNTNGGGITGGSITARCVALTLA